MYETYKTVDGWVIRKHDDRFDNPNRWLYVSKVHRDNTYSFSMDHSHAKGFSEKTVKKHLAILNKEV